MPAFENESSHQRDMIYKQCAQRDQKVKTIIFPDTRARGYSFDFKTEMDHFHFRTGQHKLDLDSPHSMLDHT